MIINGINFEEGDEITAIINNDGFILEGKISLKESYFFICHNDRYYHGDNADNKHGYNSSYTFNVSENVMVYHRVNKELLKQTNFSIPDNVYKIVKDCSQQLSNILKFSVVYGNFDNITISEKQGFIDMHSKARGKKLSIKISRFLQKVIQNYNNFIVMSNPLNVKFVIKDSIIEKIYNLFMSSHESAIKFEIVKGNNILKGYTKANYAKGGSSLQNSCMGDKQNYLLLYTQNPDKISLMIFYDTDDKICGRCLLWKADDGIEYNDRVYTAIDWLEFALNNIVKKQGYIKIYDAGITAKVSLKKFDFIKYPYLDTFYFMSIKNKTLYADPNNNIKEKYKYEFRTINGWINERHAYTEVDAE